MGITGKPHDDHCTVIEARAKAVYLSSGVLRIFTGRDNTALRAFSPE